jgi:hypothetical protein
MQNVLSGKSGLYSINLDSWKRGGNGKTGCPVTTSPMQTCPPSCKAQCYAKKGPMLWHWRKLTAGTKGMDWATLMQRIWDMPLDIWRHNQAGDLPGTGETIDRYMLSELVCANRYRRGWTYTHKWRAAGNVEMIERAIRNGFAINLSTDNMEDYDSVLKTWPNMPATTIVARETHWTPAGNRLITCPEQLGKVKHCVDCMLCAKMDRPCGIALIQH